MAVQDAVVPYVAAEPIVIDAHEDAVNGFKYDSCLHTTPSTVTYTPHSFHPWLPVVATSSGQRHFQINMSMHDSDSEVCVIGVASNPN